jgi:predicted RNA-binding Zn-ribbon protein involved in translation (DUF1610 family)
MQELFKEEHQARRPDAMWRSALLRSMEERAARPSWSDRIVVHAGPPPEDEEVEFVSLVRSWSDMRPNIEKHHPDFAATLREVEKAARSEAIKWLKENSDRVQATISTFEENQAVSIDILEFATMFVCPHCGRTFARGKFKKGTCKCGVDIFNPKEAEQVPLARPAASVEQIWTQNIWLEEGTACHFRSNGFEAETGLQVLGGSGVDHEIDIIAHRGRPPQRVFCECRHREVKPNDVLVFAGKLRDIGGQTAMMFTTATAVDEVVRRLATANGVRIVDSVLDKPKQEWDKILP